jgi:hypothetical protein
VSTFGKIVLVIGVLGLLLGLTVAIISAALVPLTVGRTSWDEAMLGIIPGIIVLVISFFITAAGVVLVFLGRKKKVQ